MEDIICPRCNDLIKPKNNWDFMDGEEHEIICPYGHQFIVKYYIAEVT